MPKRMLPFLTSWLLLLVLCLPVYAAQTENTGSIQVTLTCRGEAMAGGSLTLYPVEETDQTDTLAEYVQTNSVPGDTREIGSSGVVLFEGLQPGVYLVLQQERAPGYHSICPFQVRIPMEVGGTRVYHVKASPKVEPMPEPCEPNPTKPADPKLPQTGQRNLTAVFLTAVGLGIFAGGCLLGRRQNE